VARRVEPVIDAWFDSGSMPAAQVGYPHEPGSVEAFTFPADFISEAIDQTRGWFYSLLAVNTLVFGTSPYKHVVCLGHIIDADGRKMSKSYNNTIGLREDTDSIVKKLKAMQTDPARVRRTDPGNPDVCPVGDLHKIFSDRSTILKVDEGCRSAGIGCIECKGWAADALVSILNPMQERRKKYEENPRLAWDILEAGSSRAGKVASATMDEGREAMGMTLDYDASVSASRKSENNG